MLIYLSSLHPCTPRRDKGYWYLIAINVVGFFSPSVAIIAVECSFGFFAFAMTAGSLYMVQCVIKLKVSGSCYKALSSPL